MHWSDMYAKCGRTVLTTVVFERMPVSDVSSWTTMITGLATHGEDQGAPNKFHDMQRETIQPNRVMMLAVFSACALRGLVGIELGLLKQMEKGKIMVVPTAEHYQYVVVVIYLIELAMWMTG